MSDQSKKKTGHRFKPGESGNPGGRPKLDPEIKEMKSRILSRAITILDEKLHDEVYVKKLRPMELAQFLALAYDRCGLPKETKNEVSGKLSLEDLIGESDK